MSCLFPDDVTSTKCVWCVCSVFTLIENNAESHDMRSDSTRVTRLAPQEQMIEVGLMSTFNSIVQMCSSTAQFEDFVCQYMDRCVTQKVLAKIFALWFTLRII